MYLIIRNFKTYLTTLKQFDINDEIYEIKLRNENDLKIIPTPNERLVPMRLFKFEYKNYYVFTFDCDFVNISLLPQKYFEIIKINLQQNRRSRTLSIEAIKEIDAKRKLVKELTDFNIKYPQFAILYNSNDIEALNNATLLKNRFEQIIDEIYNFNKINLF